ncbi:MAG: hypothetical protein ABIJ83_01975, partial [Patescibacteria group bacterium]
YLSYFSYLSYFFFLLFFNKNSVLKFNNEMDSRFPGSAGMTKKYDLFLIFLISCFLAFLISCFLDFS